jgi:hypothetical protein
MCCFFQQQSWQPGSATAVGSPLAALPGERERQVENALGESVANALSAHFLLLNARLPQCGWPRQTQRQQEQSMRESTHIQILTRLPLSSVSSLSSLLLINSKFFTTSLSTGVVLEIMCILKVGDLCKYLPKWWVSSFFSSALPSFFF